MIHRGIPLLKNNLNFRYTDQKKTVTGYIPVITVQIRFRPFESLYPGGQARYSEEGGLWGRPEVQFRSQQGEV